MSLENPPISSSGPLCGLRVVEFAGLGPAPFACMLLSDMGADVVTIDRPGKRLGDPANIVGRGRTAVALDLKHPQDRDAVLDLLARADVLVEGFRPGVMERLGLGPDAAAARNPRLVYARMTGWGQDGPLAQAAGHDINYIALSGVLHAIGTPDSGPVPPLNLVGDYGGGSLYLVVGILAALHEAQRSGQGQVVDAAISDGAASLMSVFAGWRQKGAFRELRGENLLDGGCPYYGSYETADGQYVAIGPLEPPFFDEFCRRVNVPAALRDSHGDRARWPQLRQALADIFRTRNRDDWVALLEGTDACFAPVLALGEAPAHPHHRARSTFVDLGGTMHPAPAPRFSRTPSAIQGPAPAQADEITRVQERWGA